MISVKSFINFLSITAYLLFSPFIFAKESGVFNRTLPKSRSRFYQFQNALAKNYDSVFDRARKPISKDTVSKRLVQPLVQIFENYMNKENYLGSSETTLGTPVSNCRLFTYCSICNQSPQFFSQALDRVALIQSQDPNTARVFKSLNRFVGYASTYIKISVDKDYYPPTNFHDLVKRITLSGLQPYSHLKKDLNYLKLILLNTLSLLTNLKKGAVSYQHIQNLVQKYFEKDQAFVLQEMMACSKIQKKARASLPKGAPKMKIPKAVPSKQKFPLDSQEYKIYKEESQEDLFRFMSPKEIKKPQK